MTVKEFIILKDATKDDVQAKISRLQRPLKVKGISVPENLNSLSIGDLFALQGARSDIELIEKTCGTILGLKIEEALKADATEVFGFVNWVGVELEKINKLFERIKVPPTKEEKEAGVDELNFGAFGILDWYARRMGVCDHEAVAHTPWMRVYKCMEMDAKQTMYERRLRAVYANQSK